MSRIPLRWRHAAAALAGVATLALLATVSSTGASFNDDVATSVSAKAKTWCSQDGFALAKTDTLVNYQWQSNCTFGTWTIQRATNSAFSTGVATNSVAGTSVDQTVSANTPYYFHTAGTGASVGYSSWASATTEAGRADGGTLVSDYKDPQGIVLSNSKTYLRVSDYELNAIYKIRLSDFTRTTYSTGPKTGVTWTKNALRQLDIDRDGSTVYVANQSPAGATDESQDGVWKVLDGGSTAQVVSDASVAALGSGTFYGLATDNRGTGLQYAYVGWGKVLLKCPISGTPWTCSKVWTNPGTEGLQYLSAAPSSPVLLVSTRDALWTYNMDTGATDKVFEIVGGDFRGVFAVSGTQYLISSYTYQRVWNIKVDNTAHTTTTRVLTDNGSSPRGVLLDGTMLYVAYPGNADALVGLRSFGLALQWVT